MRIGPRLVLFLVLVLGVCGRGRGQISDRTAPTFSYLSAVHGLFYQGEYRDALRHFQSEWRGAIKNVQTRWIDSICYHTMIGECYYQMGQLDKALEHYTAALRLYLRFYDWMIRVQFPAAIRPSMAGRQIPWGPSARRARFADYPDSLLIGQGQILTKERVMQGGVMTPPVLFPVNPQEIVRCTCLAIRRRTELLGPLTQYDPMTSELIAALTERPAPPNHWSQCWIDVMLGLAMVAGGKETEAIPLLNRGLLAAGEFDHLMTGTALLELGRLALLRGDYTSAARFFHESSLSAAFYGDNGVLEEALRWGAVTHLVSNRPGAYPPLATATEWARRKNLRQLWASLLLSTAEQLATLGQPDQAGVTLDQAQAAIGRRTMAGGWIGARLNYLRALVLFQQRKTAAGEAALAAAMAYMRHGSAWLNQILQVDRRFVAGQITTRGPITTRSAMELYTELLRDPSPTDWALRPMESFGVLVTPHASSFEHWFLVALARKNHEKALEISDAARRHRFFSSLPLGGRLQAFRWILEAPETAIGQQAMLQRQNLLAEYPAYAALKQQADAIRAKLEALPLVAAADAQSQTQRKEFTQLAALTLQQEAVLREMALRRDGAAMVFPPVRSLKEIQAALPEGHVLLAFFAAQGDLYGFLVNRQKYSYWQVPGTRLLGRRIVSLLSSMGHYAQNRQLSLSELEDDRWRQAAQDLLDALLKGSRADFTASFPELVIVPDSILWYVPFEALQVSVDGELQSLISRFRIRYAPTVSLAVPDGRSRPLDANAAVVVGRLDPQADEATTQAAFNQLAQVVPRAVDLPGTGPLPAPSAWYSILIDQLIVLDDLAPPSAGPYGWAPLQQERNKPGNTLADWLALPWGGPDVVVLPGFHTAAENSLKGVNPAAPGTEVFLSVCGFLASGSRTLLLSRWRTGGQSSFDLVREFTQELPHATPAEAWQRAVLLAADTRIDLDAEPRIKRAAVPEPPKASHPFFWGGFFLVDPGVPADAGPGPAAAPPGQQPAEGAAQPAGEAPEEPAGQPAEGAGNRPAAPAVPPRPAQKPRRGIRRF